MKQWGEMKRWGVLNDDFLKINLAGSGRVHFIKDTTIPRRLFVSVVMVRRLFRRVCPSLKIIERCTWYDRGIRRSVDVSVSDCCRVIFCRISW